MKAKPRSLPPDVRVKVMAALTEMCRALDVGDALFQALRDAVRALRGFQDGEHVDLTAVADALARARRALPEPLVLAQEKLDLAVGAIDEGCRNHVEGE